MNIIFSIIFCWSLFFLITTFFRRLRLSAVVGMILAGIIIGSTPFKETFIYPNDVLVGILGEMGLLAIMFIAGLEVSWSMMYRGKRDAALIAMFASLTPFLLGFLVFMLMGFPVTVSLFVGLCMSITAEATKARVLIEMRKLKTRIGSLMMGAGIIDDLIGMGLFFIFAYILHAALPVGEVVLLSGVILAFFFGVFVHREIGREQKIIPHMEKALMYILVPFFFISMGLHFSGQSLMLEPLLLVIIVGVAIIGKIAGTLLTKPFTKISVSKLYLVGWGMNSRGAVELALAFIAFKSGLLPVNVYSGLIIMAMVTTLIFPVFFTRIVRRSPKIME
jgi:Kef-type K+ transport system membrane component KefB